MKSSRFFIILVTLAIVSIPACSQKEQGEPQSMSEKSGALAPQDQGAKKTEEANADEQMKLPASLSALPEVLLGTVYRDKENLALSTFRGDYVVEGVDMSNMVGLTVKVTGAVREEQGQKIVKVDSVEQVP